MSALNIYSLGPTNQSMLLPAPATKIPHYKKTPSCKRKNERTFPVNPQKGAVRLPFLDSTSFEEPFCRLLVRSTARDVVIRGRIWWRGPSSELLSQLRP